MSVQYELFCLLQRGQVNLLPEIVQPSSLQIDRSLVAKCCGSSLNVPHLSHDTSNCLMIPIIGFPSL